MNFCRALGPHGFGSYDVRWTDSQPEFSPSSGATDRLLIPGFVDQHIHGAFGIDFMTSSAADLPVLLDRLRAIGYEYLLPTTVTASADDVQSFLDRLPQHEAIAGFHLEGPFISPDYPGAQPKSWIREPSAASEWDSILDDPRLKLITMAPERPGGRELAGKLAARGVRVNFGHTAATYDELRPCEGISGSTHTYNAMRGLHHREAGALGFALANDTIYSELIYDRVHVSPPAAQILLRAKPIDKLVAVSDATMAAGLPEGTRLKMWNLDAVVGANDVRLLDGTLAGSTITLLDAFRNLSEDFGIETAIRACCINPRLHLGLTQPPKVWIELNANLEIQAIH